MRPSHQGRPAPTLRDQLIEVERQEHVAELAGVTKELEALQYRQRELVARVLSEGGSWADIAKATGLGVRAARRRWSPAPSGNIAEATRAAHAATISASKGTRVPLQGY